MRLLFVMSDDYPSRGACTNILEKLFFDGRMAITDNEISILTLKSKVHQSSYETVGAINVYRVLCWRVISLSEIKLLFVKDPILAIRGLLTKALWKLLYSTIYKRKYIHLDVANAVVKELSKLHFRSVDFVIPMVGMYDLAYASMVMKAQSQGQTKLALYQVDPCVKELDEGSITLKSQMAFEKEMFNRADIIFTTPIIRRHQSNLLTDEQLQKFHTLEFPIAEKKVVKTSPQTLFHTGKTNCLFIGNFYQNVRDPSFVLRFFCQLQQKNIVLHLIGEGEDQLFKSYKEKMGDRLILHGGMPIQQGEIALMLSDVLVNIGNRVSDQVPSKLFDYISTGKPIVNFYKNDNCPSLKYTKNYPMCLDINENQVVNEEMFDRFVSFCSVFGAKQAPFSEIRRLFPNCLAQTVSDTILDVLSSSV